MATAPLTGKLPSPLPSLTMPGAASGIDSSMAERLNPGGKLSLNGGTPIDRSISNYRPPTGAAPAAAVPPPVPAAPAPIPRPNATQPITSNMLSAPPVDYQAPAYAPNPLASTVGTYTEMATTATAAAPAVNPTRQAFQDRLLGIMETTRGKGDETNQLNQRYGIDDKEFKVTQLNNEMSAAERAYIKRKAEVEKNAKGKFGGALDQDLARMEREYLGEQADRAILLEAANGNLDTANRIITRTVDAKYKPLEAELAQLQVMFNFYQNDMTEGEKVAAQAAIKEKQDTIAYGRDRDMAAYEAALAKEGYAFEKATDAQYANTSVGTGPGTVVDAKAAQYAATGMMPADTKGAEYAAVAQRAKEMAKPTGTIVDRATGVKSSSVGAAEQSDFGALWNIIQNTERLKQLDANRADGLSGGVFGKLFGDSAQGETQSEYLAVRKAIVDDLARMQTGAALTEDEQTFYNDYLPGRFSEMFGVGTDSSKRIDNFASIMRDRLESRSTAYGLAVYGFSKVEGPDGQQYTVGARVKNADGQEGIVLPDGNIAVPDAEPTASVPGGRTSAVIGGYDIGTYATDPNHEARISTLYSKTSNISTAAAADQYIRSVAPNSPISGAQVIQAANAKGISPGMLLAIMQQDSTFGTAGKAVRTMNPGNVGNTDDGSTQAYASWYEGVLAAAGNLAKRKVS